MAELLLNLDFALNVTLVVLAAGNDDSAEFV